MQTSVLRCSRSITQPLLSSRPCWCCPSPKIRSPMLARKQTSSFERLLPCCRRYQRAGGLLKIGRGSSRRSAPVWALEKCSVPLPQISARSLPLVRMPFSSPTLIVAGRAEGASSSAPGMSGKSCRLVARTRTPSGPHGSIFRISPFKRQYRVVVSAEMRRFMFGTIPSSLFDRTGHQPANDIALQRSEDHDNWERDGRRHRHQLLPLCPVLPDELVQRDSDWLDVFVGVERQGKEKLAPCHEKGKCSDRHQAGLHQRKNHPPERAPLRAAVDLRRVLQLRRHRQEERAQH